MNHTNRIIVSVFLFLILFVILRYINSLQKEPLIKNDQRVNAKYLGHNNEFYYDDGVNDHGSYTESDYINTDETNTIEVTKSFIQ
jgi:hypothetical protein